MEELRSEWAKAAAAALTKEKGDIYSSGQVAKIVGLSASRIYEDIVEGWLTAADVGRPGPGRKSLWRIARADVENYIKRVDARQ